MQSTNKSDGITPVTAMQFLLAQASTFERAVVFVLGAGLVVGSLILAAYDARAGHAHSTPEVIERLVILGVGLAMMLPEFTLRLLAAVPLPDFMHRDVSPGPKP